MLRSFFLVLFFLLSLVNVSAQERKMWVLIVGISDYKHFNNLQFADDDAMAYHQILKKVLGKYYSEEQTRVLLNEDATAASIEFAMRWLLKNTLENDRVFIYFSGHGGYEDLTDFKLGYLHAHDAFNETYSSGGNISMEFLQAFLQSLSRRNVQTIFVADACHSGKSDGKEGFLFLNNLLAAEAKNIYKILSAQDNEKSYEHPMWGGGHGVFTYYLIKGLLGFADTAPKDGLVSLMELERYLYENVPAQTQYLQNPKVVGSPKSIYLAQVDEEQFERYKELYADDAKVNLLDALSRTDELTYVQQLSDTAKVVYELFKTSIKNYRLADRPGNDAFSYYEFIKAATPDHPVVPLMEERLYIATMNLSQEYINQVLQLTEEKPVVETVDANSSEVYTFKLTDEYNSRENLLIRANLRVALSKLVKIMLPEDPLYSRVFVRYNYMRAEAWLTFFHENQDTRNKATEVAVESIRNAIALDTTSSYLYYTYARINYFLKKYHDAQVSAEKAIRLAPAWTRPYALLGNIHYRKKNDSLSTYYFREAVKRKPTVYDYVNLAGQYFVYSWKNIGYPYIGSKLDSAALLYEKAAELSNNLNEKIEYSDFARMSLIQKYYLASKNIEDLMRGYALINRFDSFPETSLSILYEAAKSQVKLMPEEPRGYINYSRYYAAKNKFSKSSKMLSKAKSKGYSNWPEYEHFGEVGEFTQSKSYKKLKSS
ncbi:MAG: caspase family protein [Cyclobacteriaceae bacterium]|nr:caspase family protein [Cyclobacteriaceae bacterium]UYN86906.1 MAG: caspase family protein [Cyclobacteriaceae bacterium]